jgi:hypothetical protein
MYLTQSIRITLDGASETFSILDKLTNKFTNQNLIFTINHQAKLKQEEICRYFDLNGSDKGSYHEYHLVYGSLLAEINKNNIVIGEIGIGSNNIRVPSNMGKSGIPGASLRSWAMLGNVTKVIGLDIDKKVLISEDKIDSYHLDQTNDKSWQISEL